MHRPTLHEEVPPPGRPHRSALPACILILGLTLTSLLAASALREARRTDAERFDALVTTLQSALEQRLLPFHRQCALKGVRSVFLGSEIVTRAEFNNVVAQCSIPEEFPGASGVCFVRRVMREDLGAFLARTRADGAPDFRIKTSGDEPDLMIVEYIAPPEISVIGRGFDIGSELRRREAAERAMHSGQTSITAPLTLLQDPPGGPGFLLLLPVYRNGAPTSTPEERTAALDGWIQMPLLMGPLVQGLVGVTRSELSLEIFDGELADPERLMHADGMESTSRRFQPQFTHVRTIPFAGRNWTIRAADTPSFVAASRATPALIGGSGAAFSILAAALLARESRRRNALNDSGARVAGALRARTDELTRLAVVAERTTNAVLILDADRRIVWCNDAFSRMTGFTLAEVVGSVPSDMLHATSFDSDAASRIDYAMTHGESCRVEARRRRRDGAEIWVDLEVQPIKDDLGAITGFIAIKTDITQRKRAEAEMRAASDAAHAATIAKSEFLANMSHEIRTPLTAILGYSELLADQSDQALAPEQRADYLDTIRRNGNHLLAIINDILDLSKIEAGKVTLESVPVDPSAVVSEVVALMRGKADAKRLRLTATATTDLPASVRTDPLRLRQILLNLAGNAVKFTESGSVTVRIGYLPAAIARPADGGTLRVEVIDTGIGIDPAFLDALFLPFEQADSSTTRRFGGTGLGLRISKRLAAMLDGDITVVSTPGAGSTFTLTIATGPLPSTTLVPRAIAISDDPGPAGDRPAPSATDLTGIRILLAEDSTDNQRLIAFHLRKAGAQVILAEDGKRALEALCTDGAHHKPLRNPPPVDLVLTDMQMPEMDGYSLARVLRERGFTRPIIAITAHAMAADRDRCLAAGCDDYASKPVDPATLIRICREACDRAGARSPATHAA
jgi:PAS domain S-box-containing protein